MALRNKQNPPTTLTVQRNDWYKIDGKYDSYIMIPATPDSILKTNIDKHVESLRLKVKVIEKHGTKLSETIKGQIITPIPKCLDPK